MAKKAIIVESPTKTRTLARFLGEEYKLLASRGHVRDLPEKDLAVDVAHGFAPHYEVIPRQKKTLRDLAEALKGIDEVYLASDPDREGEAIAWHLAEALKLHGARRIEFSEITESAVREALAHPRELDQRLINAQQARRVLDRLVGYGISPLLWRQLRSASGGGLSAGRVQSVALRLIVDREREVLAFVPEEYWTLTAQFTPLEREQPFPADLKEKDGEKIALSSQEQAEATVEDLRRQQFVVGELEDKTRKRNAQPPFITSTLQRAAAAELGFSASRTMRVAQGLYEGVEIDGDTVGLITYMRTDSTQVAASAQEQAREFIAQQYGPDYVGAGVRGKKAKGAQEAHECIRPSSVLRSPAQMAAALDRDQTRLYELIWRRFVASQMAPAQYRQRGVDILGGPYLLRATSSRVTFPGYLAVLPEKEETSAELPDLVVGQELRLLDLTPDQHFTQPPPRYNEGTLVQALEELGIGRPSTYAPTIETLRQRKYVEMQKRSFLPTRLGAAVCDYLVDHFPEVMNVEFTARMEEDLDTVEQGQRDWTELLEEFYAGFSARLAEVKTQPPVELEERCPQCDGRLLARYSAFGKFAGCENYPECDYTRDLSGLPSPEREQPVELEEACPQCGAPLVQREGRRGPFVGCSAYPKCRYARDPVAAEGEQGPEPAPGAEGDCPQCGAPLVQRRSRRGPFWGCSAYPKCRYIKGSEQRPAAVVTPWPCEQCDKPLVLRQGKRGAFLGCSGFPRCRFTREPTAAESAELQALSAASAPGQASEPAAAGEEHT